MTPGCTGKPRRGETMTEERIHWGPKEYAAYYRSLDPTQIGEVSGLGIVCDMLDELEELRTTAAEARIEGIDAVMHKAKTGYLILEGCIAVPLKWLEDEAERLKEQGND